MKKSADTTNKKKGVLIVFEGLSGSGKSLNTGLLRNQLISMGYDPVLTEWNSNAIIRKFVAWLDSRGLLTSTIYSLLQWMGFLIDYFKVILPSLLSRKIVIADRYVYTGLTRDAVNGAWKKPGRVISRFVRKPDHIYFIDTPSGICLERLKARNTKLFHTNRRIRESRLLKNKDLYYLNKMRNEYNRLFADTEQLKSDKVLQVVESENNSIDWSIVTQICDTKIEKFKGALHMQRKDIENKICEILKNHCQYNADDIAVDKDLRENYGVDSLILVELLVEIEAGFGITFDSEMLTYDHFSTVASLVDYVFTKVGGEQEVSCI